MCKNILTGFWTETVEFRIESNEQDEFVVHSKKIPENAVDI